MGNAGAETQTSLGEDIRAAVSKLSTDEPVVIDAPVVETQEVTETPEAKAARERDEQGRFAPKKEAKAVDPAAEPESADANQQNPATENQAPAAALKAPAALKPAIKAKWAELSPEVQQEFVRLESTQQKGMQKIAEDARFGQTLREVVSPHEATFKALGIDAPRAVDALLKADYTLRTAHPREKAQYLLQLAKNYGADMSVFQPAPVDGQTPAQQPQVDPAVAAMWNRLQQIEQSQHQQQTERERIETEQASSSIEAFRNDPKNEFFEDVREDMAILINSGRAKTLQEAYDMATYANPETRQAVLDRQFAEREAKRKADQAKAVETKRAAGVSVRSSGPAQIVQAGKDESVRETLLRVSAGGGRI